jgi:vancomycin resistance protein YoaR
MIANVIVFVGYLVSVTVLAGAVAQAYEPLVTLALLAAVFILTMTYMAFASAGSSKAKSVTNISNAHQKAAADE